MAAVSRFRYKKRNTQKSTNGLSSAKTARQVPPPCPSPISCSSSTHSASSNTTNVLGTIGVSVYAAKNLGDVVFVELPALDLEIKAGDSMGAVESVKSASDILSPVSGKIIEANDVLQEKPGTINKSPEGEGWIARIQVKDGGEVEKLMSMDEYAKFTAE
ncbi:hypothetical protein HO173_003561 [Letharia columbiana]|uniref:Glycine cleavage system H protein n=1 Tax=Letharia columbiana TaxID=112416 RepID=A0A8H6L792_9LECA|nr:uncharacterized protein HO173_003561 [Letharia columbiana]KAF6238281.1 hypothetical protein HO173_003561 [Letharia columbiana]